LKKGAVIDPKLFSLEKRGGRVSGFSVQLETMCCHQSRDIPTPGFPKLPRDGEKHNPGVVFGSSICWA